MKVSDVAAQVAGKTSVSKDDAKAAVGAPVLDSTVTSACQKIDIYLNPRNKWRFKIAKSFHVK